MAITQNESAVFLNWTRPLHFPSNGSYYITTNCSKAQPNRTVQVEIIYITELEPGVTCFSTVYSQVNNIAGDPVSIDYSTSKEPCLPTLSCPFGLEGVDYVHFRLLFLVVITVLYIVCGLPKLCAVGE